MAVQIQLRRDTAADWTSINPILAQGEAGLETDTNKLKIGDGLTAWNTLPYFAGNGHTIENNGTPLTARANLNFKNGLSAADNTPDTDVKLGGTLTEPVAIDGAQSVIFGGVTPLSAYSHYVQVGDVVSTVENDAEIVNIDSIDTVAQRGASVIVGDLDSSGDMVAHVGVYDATSYTNLVLNALTGIGQFISTYVGAALNFIGVTLNLAKGTDIASATTTDIGAATGNYVEVTGTTTITGLGTVQAGATRIVTFTGILTLTHNATSLILPGGANITTAAGDSAEFVSLGSGNWKCVNYQLASSIGGGSTITVGDTQVLFADGADNPAGEAAFTYNKTTNTLDVDNVTVDDEAYDATGWNGSLEVPTKNAVRDKFESIVTSINGAIAVRPVVFDGMGAVILAGSKTYVRALFAGTITGWSIIADGSSPTCTLDIKKIATGTTLPSSSIVASDPPDLTTGNAIDSTSLTGWTTSIVAGDLLEISVTAATVMTKMEFALRVS